MLRIHKMTIRIKTILSKKDLKKKKIRHVFG